MARTPVSVTNSADIASGVAAKTILQYTAPANTKAAVRRAWISFRGISPTQNKIRIQLIRSATGGTGASAVIPQVIDATDSTTAQGTAKENFGTEPGGGVVIFDSHLHAQSDYYTTDEIIVKPGQTIGWCVTADLTTPTICGFKVEE